MSASNSESGPALLLIRAFNRLGRPFGINPFPRAFPNPVTEDLADRAEVFDEIYDSNFWGSDESRSGLGSELNLAGAYVARLRDLLNRHKLTRVFDAPCGDLNWILGLARDPAFGYIGGDISAKLIADLKLRYPKLDLRQFDVCRDAFPEVDVWHCRDCLFHLPFADIRKAFAQFAELSIPYALLTTHKARLLHRNLDVSAGGFRFVDLERAPIALPPAEHYIPDYKKGSEFPRYVGLWSREAIRAALAKWPG